MKIGVVGSRNFSDYDFLEQVLDSLLAFYGKFQIVSGGAEGADTMAVRWANSQDFTWPIVYDAYWDDLSHPDAVIKTSKSGRKYDAMAGFRRNQQIVDDVDLLVAFMNPNSPTPGTSDTISKAKKRDLAVIIFWPKE